MLLTNGKSNRMQHDCVSGRNTYSKRNFVPIVHEYLMVCRKDSLSSFLS